jgi:methanogenic corrinoid protein MtbC1
MHQLLKDFIKVIETEDKSASIDFAISKLQSGELDIVTLYSEILTPALNNMKCDGPEEFCIWKEHVRSSIIRSIIENCFPHVEKERNEKYQARSTGEKVMVLCPTEELHEIGPRMVADFFTLLGYDVTFVGANTPKKSFLSAIETLKPVYVAMSVTNYYNLSAARRTVEDIRGTKHGKVRIIVGGHAFRKNPGAYKEIGADALVDSFSDLKKLKGGV